MLDLDQLKSDRSALVRAVESAGTKFRGDECKCPICKERHASAGVFRDENNPNIWRYKCNSSKCNFSGTIIDVQAWLNKRSPTEELRAMAAMAEKPRRTDPPPRTFPNVQACCDQVASWSHCERVEAVYTYNNPETKNPDLIVVRYLDREEQKKKFSQFTPSLGGFVNQGVKSGKWPIYNRTRIAAADTVLVVEGEKCVHALADVGIVATTSAGGCATGNAARADWTPLAGKTVFLWPDNDAPNEKQPQGGGVEHMRAVQQELQKLSPSPKIMWIDPAPLEIPVKGDVVQVIERYAESGMGKEEIKSAIEAAILAEAEPIDELAGYRQRIQDSIDGKRRLLPFPWKCLTNATRALIPGTITCFVGEGGSTKSLMIIESLVYWVHSDKKCAIYELEEDAEFHLSRAHAQLDGNKHLTEAEWIEANPQLAKDATDRHAEVLSMIRRCIWDAPENPPTLKQIGDWIEERAKEKYEIIIVDPVTAAAPDPKPWIADCEFIYRTKTIARVYNTRILFVIHPRKGGARTSTLDDLAGGAAYSRITHNVIWIEVYEKDDELLVRTNPRHPPEPMLPNRIAKILKCRNGTGRGKRIAMDFILESLTFRELGLVEKA